MPISNMREPHTRGRLKGGNGALNIRLFQPSRTEVCGASLLETRAPCGGFGVERPAGGYRPVPSFRSPADILSERAQDGRLQTGPWNNSRPRLGAGMLATWLSAVVEGGKTPGRRRGPDATLLPDSPSHLVLTNEQASPRCAPASEDEARPGPVCCVPWPPLRDSSALGPM